MFNKETVSEARAMAGLGKHNEKYEEKRKENTKNQRQGEKLWLM